MDICGHQKQNKGLFPAKQKKPTNNTVQRNKETNTTPTAAENNATSLELAFVLAGAEPDLLELDVDLGEVAVLVLVPVDVVVEADEQVPRRIILLKMKVVPTGLQMKLKASDEIFFSIFGWFIGWFKQIPTHPRLTRVRSLRL